MTTTTIAIGGDSWLGALHADCAEPLRRFLLRLTSEHHLTEDLLQETFLRAWRSRETVPSTVEEARRWLFTVARRVAIDASRARRARPEVSVTDFTRVPDERDPYERVVAAHTIREALPKLSTDHRAVLLELYFAGRSTAEAAARLGIAEGTVKSRAHYALRSLRALVDQQRA
jgi:RNA polymerase sigma-70 factor (ECF subfamily)